MVLMGGVEKIDMNGARKRVLVADDDSGILESVRSALVHRGYEVLVAHDGAEALTSAERDAPDLIVLDMVMPKRSGLAVIDRLHRNKTRTTPIIVVSGNNDERHRQYASERGVDAYIAKPFDIDRLIEQVDTILNS